MKIEFIIASSNFQISIAHETTNIFFHSPGLFAVIISHCYYNGK